MEQLEGSLPRCFIHVSGNLVLAASWRSAGAAGQGLQFLSTWASLRCLHRRRWLGSKSISRDLGWKPFVIFYRSSKSLVLSVHCDQLWSHRYPGLPDSNHQALRLNRLYEDGDGDDDDGHGGVVLTMVLVVVIRMVVWWRERLTRVSCLLFVGTVLYTLYVFSNLILIIILYIRDYYNTHFTDEATEAERVYKTYPKLISQ